MKKTEPALLGADRKVCNDAAHSSDFPAVGDFVMAGKTGEGTQAVIHQVLHKEFEKCAKEHINSDDIRYRVYRRGLEYPVFAEELKSIILPVYQSAQNCGFGRWKY